MQTTLPDLPFPCKGIFSDQNDPRTSHKSKPRAFPRTADLVGLHEWTSFNLDIDHAIHTVMQEKGLPQNMPCTAGPLFSNPKQVWAEEEIRSRADAELHTTVQEILELLGIKGTFRTPGGNCALIGAPDFYWVSTGDGHPKLVVPTCFTFLVLTVYIDISL